MISVSVAYNCIAAVIAYKVLDATLKSFGWHELEQNNNAVVGTFEHAVFDIKSFSLVFGDFDFDRALFECGYESFMVRENSDLAGCCGEVC